VVIVTHNPEVARQSDRIVRIRDGVIESEVVLSV
jgi:ABC-type lipoprotein export system ATPase subunit